MFFFNDTATTEIYTLSLHDALPISCNYDLPNVICVAATDRSDRLAEFSNRGARTVDLAAPGVAIASTDRKSTRLNSSHANISYAVFCLKKKKTHYYQTLFLPSHYSL